MNQYFIFEQLYLCYGLIRNEGYCIIMQQYKTESVYQCPIFLRLLEIHFLNLIAVGFECYYFSMLQKPTFNDLMAPNSINHKLMRGEKGFWNMFR